MLGKKKEVIKHSSAIQISNNITLLQRRAWNLLLSNAYDDLLTKDEYKVSIKELSEALCLDIRNIEHLRQSLLALMECVVQWNILNKDKEQWGASHLLSEVTIENNILYYSYGTRFKEKLYNPKMYARISLSMQNRFNSKYSLALYELAVDYFMRDKHFGQTPFIEVSKFRQLMGLEIDEYKLFKDLNKFVIKQSIKEINAKSDLFIEVETQKEIRKITALKFHIKANPNKSNKIEIKPIKELKKDIIEHRDDIELKKEILGETLKTDFLQSKKQAQEILNKYENIEILEELLQDIEKRYKNKEIDNLGAYTYKLLTVHNQKFKKSKFDVEKEEKEKVRAETEQKAQLEKQREELRPKYDDLVKSKALETFETMEEMEQLKVRVAFEVYLENINEKTYQAYQLKGFSDIMARIEFKKFMLDKGYLKVMPFDEYADKIINQNQLWKSKPYPKI